VYVRVNLLNKILSEILKYICWNKFGIDKLVFDFLLLREFILAVHFVDFFMGPDRFNHRSSNCDR
jgi:hypothetical protein